MHALTASRRLLFLLPFPPRADAAHGGSRVMAGLIGELAARHRVGLLYLQASEDAPLDDDLVRKCTYVEAVPRPEVDANAGTRRSYRLRLWSSLLAGKPAWAVQWDVPAFGRRLQEVARIVRPDVVQAEFHVMGQYFDAVPRDRAVRVLVEHEPGSPAARERLRAGRGGGRVLPYADYLAWQRYERATMRRADAVVTFTERDRTALLTSAGRTPVVVIPLGTTLPKQPLEAEGSEPGSVLFFGNFMHPPNVDAARRLTEEIFPRIVARHSGATLYLVGDRAPTGLGSSTTGSIIVTGWVPDVQPYLDRAALVVVPMRLGGGMRVKVLEALAAGKAVVATRLAVEGLGLIDGEQVVLAETDEDIAAAAAALLEDPRRRAALARAARAWACEHLGWDRPAAVYEELYTGLIRARSRE